MADSAKPQRSSPTKRKAILVLGMHRSGTSALTGVIGGLGVSTPKSAAPPNEWNARGYFESPRFFHVFDDMLAAMGSCWDDWRQADSQWLRSDAADIHRQKVRRVILEEFAQEGPIVLKDPRICRFVPFVASILDELGFEHVAILPIRNPLEVTYSLRRRDKFELSKSFLLWLRHVLDAEYNSRTMPRYFLPYEGLLTDWRHQLQRAANRTGIVWPNRSQAAAAAIDQFLSPDLRHDQASVRELEDHALKLPLVMETYTALRRLVEDEGDTAARRKLDGARRQFDKTCKRAGAAASPDQIVAVLSSSGSLVPAVVSNMRRWLARRRPQRPS